MIILQVDASEMLAEWVQAGAAIATVIISIVVFAQSKTIRELVDITKELGKQNEILSKRLTLELSLTMDQRMPVFESSGISKDENSAMYIITLKNTGKKAFKLMTHTAMNISVSTENDSCGPGGIVNIQIKYTTVDGLKREAFLFNIHFHDNTNTFYTQRIHQLKPNSDYFTDLPTITVAGEDFPIKAAEWSVF